MQDETTYTSQDGKDPHDYDPVELREMIEALRMRLGVLELKDKTPEELEYELKAEQLERAGFTEGQVRALLMLIEDAGRSPIKRLGVQRRESAARRRARFAPARLKIQGSDFANVAYGASFVDDEGGYTPSESWNEYIPGDGGYFTGGTFDSPSPLVVGPGRIEPSSSPLDVLLPAVAGVMVGYGLHLILRDRRDEPLRPWWQRKLRDLLGV